MGSKNSPGEFDCYAAAQPDEPLFVLLGRDPCACLAVTFWVKLRQELDPDDPKLENAREVARELEAYARSQGKGDEIVAALGAMRKIVVDPAKPRSWLEKVFDS